MAWMPSAVATWVFPVPGPPISTMFSALPMNSQRCSWRTIASFTSLAHDGTPIKRIVRLTGLSRGLVRQIVRGEREDVFRIRESSLTPWLPRLEKEWADGCRNGAELWRRLRGGGFQGSLRVVGEWATRQR